MFTISTTSKKFSCCFCVFLDVWPTLKIAVYYVCRWELCSQRELQTNEYIEAVWCVSTVLSCKWQAYFHFSTLDYRNIHIYAYYALRKLERIAPNLGYGTVHLHMYSTYVRPYLLHSDIYVPHTISDAPYIYYYCQIRTVLYVILRFNNFLESIWLELLMQTREWWWEGDKEILQDDRMKMFAKIWQ